MIKKRNEALVGRYYYWTEVQRLRFDDALRILSETEFFISEQRIMAIIRAVVSSSESAQRKPGKRIKKPKITRTQLDMLQDAPQQGNDI